MISNKNQFFIYTYMFAKFHRVKCGEWRMKNKGKNLKKLQQDMLQETLKKCKNGDIIYLADQ